MEKISNLLKINFYNQNKKKVDNMITISIDFSYNLPELFKSEFIFLCENQK
jgi:hypothetical protein